MSNRRAIHLDKEKNKKAVAAANAAVADRTGGRPINPDETELREAWMDAYIAAGGEYEEVKPRGRKPSGTSPSCPLEKTVTGRIASVTFRSDHLRSGGKKLLKRTVEKDIHVLADDNSKWNEAHSLYYDSDQDFQKPE